MKGDFSRDTFDRAKHFSRVLMQQGRVQLDADWNEQSAILLHYVRTLTADLIGPFAGPAREEGKLGSDFQVSKTESETGNFEIGAGHYYVDGILCENDTQVRYSTQQDFPNPPLVDPAAGYLVYLDVWEHHITALENDDIREKALGGPDTASRTKVVWQVKLQSTTDAEVGPLASELSVDEIRTNWSKWIDLWQPHHLGCLKAKIERPAGSSDPCLMAPDVKYRGAENQLYRVEIHTAGEGGLDKVTFKWSRDNGAIVTGCQLRDKELTVQNPHGFSANHWVELTNEGQELRGNPGVLVKVTKVEIDKLTLGQSPSKPTDIPTGEDWPTKVRRWDQSEKGGATLADDGAVLVQESAKDSGWIDLEAGIRIRFTPSPIKDGRNRYRTGDYWLIPARVATGDIEWPVQLKNDKEPERDSGGNTIPLAKPPRGIRHHYAPLALLRKGGDAGWDIEDCRCAFTALNNCKMISHGEDGMGGTPTCLRGRH